MWTYARPKGEISNEIFITTWSALGKQNVQTGLPVFSVTPSSEPFSK